MERRPCRPRRSLFAALPLTGCHAARRTFRRAGGRFPGGRDRDAGRTRHKYTRFRPAPRPSSLHNGEAAVAKARVALVVGRIVAAIAIVVLLFWLLG